MRILVLDDERYRHEEYARRYRSHDVTHAWTVAQALDALSGDRFDLATLDHDLGSDDGTGLDVADAIAQMPKDRAPIFVCVHSFNPPGARIMVATLKRAGIPSHHRPFTCGPITEGEP